MTTSTVAAARPDAAEPSLPEDIVVVYGPSISVIPDTSVYETVPETILGPPVVLGTLVIAGSSRAFLQICDGQLIELRRRSMVGIDHENRRLVLKTGTVLVHTEEAVGASCYSFQLEGASLRNASRYALPTALADSLFMMPSGGVLTVSGEPAPDQGWWRPAERDGRYLFDLMRNRVIPSQGFEFDFPSERRRRSRFRHTSTGEGGIATYSDQRYYVASILYRLRSPELDFAYDFWFAVSKDGKFYKEAWDEWRDLIDHIHHLQLYGRGDPWNLRIGLLQDMAWEHGLLVDGYSNAVFLPFEKHNGLQIELNRGDTYGTLFANDIGKPRVFGARVSWKRNSRTRLSINYVGDLDQLSNLTDSDGDSYPDEADPEPDIHNDPADSVIGAADPPRLDELESVALHGVSLGLAYRYKETATTSVSLTGEAAANTKGGSGVTFPNVVVGYRSVLAGVGFDLQSPHFISGIFDRNFEFDKARFLTSEDGTVELITYDQALDDAGDWLFGWSNSVAISLPEDTRFGMRFRDIYRGDRRDKSFWLSLRNERGLTRYRIRGGFFIEQKNVSELFRTRTHGQIWGAQFTLYPHHTTRLRLRYRERSSDDDGNGSISSGEVARNVNASVTVDGTYWWNRLEKWWSSRHSGGAKNPGSVSGDVR